MLARAGVLVMVAVDTVMTGRAGGDELAYYGLTSSPMIPLLLIGIGLVMGVMILTAQAHGGGNSLRCGHIWRVGMVHAFGYGCILLVMLQYTEQFFLIAGQQPDLASGAASALRLFGWGMPALLCYTCSVFFLEALYRPVAGVVVMIIANLANAGLNWLLIYGNAGFEPMGVDGAALATTLARWLAVALIVIWIFIVIERRVYGLTGPLEDFRKLGRELRRIGYPMALGHGLESSAFAVLTLVAGLTGAASVASYTVGMNMIALVFMLALGFGTAASIRVANFHAQDRRGEARTAGLVAALLAVALVTLAGLIIFLFADKLAGLYVVDGPVRVLTVSVLVIVAFTVIPDGLQAVLIGALRGLSDVWPATLMLAAAFWLVMLPVAWYLGVTRALGSTGVMLSVVFGAVVASILMLFRFLAKTRQR